MDFLFAKTTGRTGTFCKILSNQTIYNRLPIFDDIHSYQDDLKLSDEQWFCLSGFKDKTYAPILIKNQFRSIEWSQIGRNDYNKIDYIVSIQNEGKTYIFQNITPSAIYKQQSLVSLDEQPTLLNKDHLLIIHQTPDAYYLRENDTLYFKRLSAITTVFPGINELYNEATDAEVEEILNLDILAVSSEFTKDKVKTANRRKIREAMDLYRGYTDKHKGLLTDYIRKYCDDLQFDESTSKFSISDEKGLTKLLNGLCQRYYTTEISQDKRVALSVENV